MREIQELTWKLQITESFCEFWREGEFAFTFSSMASERIQLFSISVGSKVASSGLNVG